MVSEPASPARASKGARPKKDRAEKMARVQWGIGLGITALLVVLAAFGLIRRPELSTEDFAAQHFFSASPHPSADLCLVGIDDASLENSGRWPWSRAKQAVVINEMNRAGASVIALDITYNIPEPLGFNDDGGVVHPDAELASAMRASGKVVLGCDFPAVAEPGDPPGFDGHRVPFSEVFERVAKSPEITLDSLKQALASSSRAGEDSGRPLLTKDDAASQSGPVIDDLRNKLEQARIVIRRQQEFTIAEGRRPTRWWTSTDPEFPASVLLEACALLGSVSAEGIDDGDNVVRRMPLWVRQGGRLYPTLGLAAAAEYLGVPISKIRVEDNYTIIPEANGDIRLEMHGAPLSKHSAKDGLIHLAWPTGKGAIGQFAPDGAEFKRQRGRAKGASSVSTSTTPATDSQCDQVVRRFDINDEVPIGAFLEPKMREDAVKQNLREIDAALRVLSDPKYHGDGALITSDNLSDFEARSRLLQELSIDDPRWSEALKSHLKAWAACEDTAKFYFPDGFHTPDAEKLKGAEREVFEQTQLFAERYPLARKQIECGIERLNSIRASLRARVNGKLCLVGWVAVGSIADFVATSIDGRTPGMFLHAAVANEILTRHQKKLTPTWVSILGYGAMVLMGIVGTMIGVRIGVVWGPVALLTSAALSLVLSGVVFFDHWNAIPLLASPSIAAAAAWLGVILHRLLFEQRARKQTEARFRSYVSPDVVDILVNNPELQSMAPTRKELTIMFSDVANWTTITERLGTEGVFKFLSTYLREMTDIIQANKATLDKYLGDGIMAFWGAPIDDPEHAQNACKACVEMIQKLNEMNARGDFGPAGSVEVRFGLATGEVNVGDFGNPPSKSAYTVIGDAVNLAARLESSNKQFGSSILMTKRVLELSGSTLLFRPIGRIVVKGKTEYEELYELIGDRRPKGDRTDAWVAQTKKAVEAYQRGELDAAEREWGVLKEEYDDKKLAGLYLAAIARLRETGIPEGFEGELELTEK